MNDWEDRIRERAFHIWLNEGRPHGQAERHWHLAKLAMESEPSSDGLRSTGDSSAEIESDAPPTTEQPSLGDPVTATRAKAGISG
jgi:hypothetical protein